MTAATGLRVKRSMTIGAHLAELRRRFLITVAAIVVGAIAGWLLSPILWDAMQRPVEEVARVQGNALLVFPAVTTAFDLRLQLALVSGVVVASPIWLYQAFAFVLPAMKKRERILTLSFVAAAFPLFLAGAAAGWVILPHMVAIMTSFVPPQAGTFLDASLYFQFVLKLIIVVGIAFVLPVFLVGLNVAGLLSAASIIKSWRIAVLVITLFTALATPAADVLSMIILAIPMTVLFFGAWFICWLRDRSRARRAAAST